VVEVPEDALPAASEDALITFEVVTLFPEMFAAIERSGITRRAMERGLWQAHYTNPRDFAVDAHRTVDDRPYGGGPGMVMMAEPLAQAIAACRSRHDGAARVIHFSPAGERLTHRRVMDLTGAKALVLLCGRYEGMDQRLIDRHVDLELSLGDFVLSGGEIPAMALMDAIVRQLPGALNDASSAIEDSFVAGLLDCPHYTRPETWEGQAVPEVLLSGDHARIRRWRAEQALALTRRRRPDLL
jgi:tRNA (guanine37-N1)-methyltransferase